MEQPLWPWLALAGLGAFHGLNPAMGWLFAVAHGLAIAAVALIALAFGLVVAERPFRLGAALLLAAMAAWQLLAGQRHRLRVGMQAGLAGLVLWSALMATSHGAGLMLIPALTPICLTGSPGAEIAASGATSLALAAVGVHMGAMLAVMAAVALAVYETAGLAVLRSGWVNLDLVWCGALLAAALWLAVGSN
jgi:hypothetical protein